MPVATSNEHPANGWERRLAPGYGRLNDAMREAMAMASARWTPSSVRGRCNRPSQPSRPQSRSRAARAGRRKPSPRRRAIRVPPKVGGIVDEDPRPGRRRVREVEQRQARAARTTRADGVGHPVPDPNPAAHSKLLLPAGPVAEAGIARACPNAECDKRQAPREFTSDVRLPGPLPRLARALVELASGRPDPPGEPSTAWQHHAGSAAAPRVPPALGTCSPPTRG